MDMTHSAYWDDSNIPPRMKYEGCSSNDEMTRTKDERGIYQCCETNLNFSTATCSEDDSEYGPYKKNKVTRQDPMSHRIIEKRRRDRMNNCLADLSRLIPTEYLKKGRGRIEKTEIIEMAIKHMKYLQQEHGTPSEHYRMGYQECMSETMRFMVEVEGHFPREGICVRILNHLQKHCDSLLKIRHPTGTNSIPTVIEHRLPQQQQQQQQTHETVITQPQQIQQQQQRPVLHYQIAKDEPNNNINYNDDNNNNGKLNESVIGDGYDRHNHDFNGNTYSYKYKTNIKLRFNQDLHEGAKRQKIDDRNGRRASIASVENHSSSRSSPPISEVCTRLSEAEPSRISPISPIINHLKTENNQRPDIIRSYSPLPQSQNHNNNNNHHPPQQQQQKPHIIDDKTNFNIPIFVLHTKGSYYLPLTIDYKTLVPYLRNYDLIDAIPENRLQNLVLHPVTINVNFQPNINGKYKSEFNINNNWN